MRTLGNIFNALVCIGLLLMGIVMGVALISSGSLWSGVLILAIMSLAALGHFLSQRFHFLVLFDGVFLVFSLILCLAIAMR